eukprot:1156636-Pelagomonas_calceolata.AAC.14
MGEGDLLPALPQGPLFWGQSLGAVIALMAPPPVPTPLRPRHPPSPPQGPPQPEGAPAAASWCM